MNVHQLSIAYMAEQDRILARVNTREGRELQFWFTRRLTLGITPLIDKAVAEHAGKRGGLASSRLADMDDMARKAVAQFQRSEILKGADFATPYKTSDAAVPLFETPLLVTEVNIASLGNGQLRMQFAEKLAGRAGNRTFQMALSDQLVQAFVHLLARAIRHSQWRESMPAGLSSLPDFADAPEKPGYLN